MKDVEDKADKSYVDSLVGDIENGATFTPNVSDDGVISWTNDKGLDNPKPINIKGEGGKDGFSPTIEMVKTDNGYFITVTDVNGANKIELLNGTDGKDGADGKNGLDGVDGISTTHNWEGTVLTVTSSSGTSSADLKGEQGPQGEKGDTGDPGKDAVTDQTYNPESENAQSGIAVAEAVVDKMAKFADVTIEKSGASIKQILLDILKNNNGIPVQLELKNYLDNNQFASLFLDYIGGQLKGSVYSELNASNGMVQVGNLKLVGPEDIFEETDEKDNPYTSLAKITAQILGVSGLNGVSPIRIINVADPKNDLDVANKRYVDNEIATFDFIKVVDTLPEEGLPNKIYLVPKEDPQTNDLFDEYIWINKGTEENPIYYWEFVTTKQVEIDLTSYAKTSYVDNLVAQKSQIQIITWEDDD